MRVLAGDIRGTKTALAVFEVTGKQLELAVLESYPSQEYTSLDEIVRRFIEAHEPGCGYASFGIAGPVRDGRCETTNLPWLVDAARLQQENGFQQVWLMNDLAANAWGIGALQTEDFHTLNEGSVQAEGNASIISAGTGLGEAGLFWDGSRHRPFASEGGHTDFAPLQTWRLPCCVI